MSRIAARFAALRAEGRGALIPFLEAWDPDAETSLAILRGMPAAGADLIEIGMPFTDPMADGPIIQAAAVRALRAGASTRRTLAMVRSFREGDADTPVVLMGYLNPVLSYGAERFCADAASAGVDGLIVVDLPTEEADLLLPSAAAHGLDVIRLVAPTTDARRLPQVLQGSSGFVYYVSIAGVTGTRSASTAELEAALPRLRAATGLPVAIGFGVRTPEQAAVAASTADAAVVASALIQTLAASLDAEGRAAPDTAERVLAQVRALAAGVRGGRRGDVARDGTGADADADARTGVRTGHGTGPDARAGGDAASGAGEAPGAPTPAGEAPLPTPGRMEETPTRTGERAA